MTTVTFASQVSAPGATVLGPVSHAETGTDPTRQSSKNGSPFLQAPGQELAAYAQVVAHNLKSPLAVIISTADAISNITDLTREELHAYLEQIHSTAHNIDHMIDTLVLMAQLDGAKVPVGPLDMSAIVKRAQERLFYLIRLQHAELIFPKAWPVAVGYAPWIEEVWTNFINNAIKYGGRPARIEMGAMARPDEMVLFWVRSNGSGIPADKRAQLFLSFPTSSDGRGPGLSVVRQVVEKLGGQVGIETEAGGGSQFFFTLPAHR